MLDKTEIDLSRIILKIYVNNLPCVYDCYFKRYMRLYTDKLIINKFVNK